MSNVGILAISGKPVHNGHWKLIELAAKENDVVYLYVSTSDRKRKGEVSILGDDMKTIWKRYLAPILPNNVVLEYSSGSPIQDVYAKIDEYEMSDPDQTISLYSDPADMAARFSDHNLSKYFPDLFARGAIERRAVERADDTDTSGTMMRRFIADNKRQEFMDRLPPVSKLAKGSIWKMLQRGS